MCSPIRTSTKMQERASPWERLQVSGGTVWAPQPGLPRHSDSTCGEGTSLGRLAAAVKINSPLTTSTHMIQLSCRTKKQRDTTRALGGQGTVDPNLVHNPGKPRCLEAHLE